MITKNVQNMIKFMLKFESKMKSESIEETIADMCNGNFDYSGDEF